MSSVSKPARAGHGLLPGNAQIQALFILVIALIVALVTVVNMMQGNYTNLFIGLTIAGIALYIGVLWKHSWFVAVLIGLMGFSIAPTSFWIPADFMCYGLADAMAMTLLMRRALGSPSPPLMLTPGLRASGMVIPLAVYLCYLLIQGMMGEVAPVYAGQYNVRNTVKAYAEDMFPAFTLIVLIIMRYRLPSMATLAKWMTPVMLLALIPLCIYRAYQISKGHYEGDETTDYFGILIPVINLIPNEFSLRVGCPIAALWASSLIFSKHVKLTKTAWILNALLIVIAVGGSILSAGRAVPALVLFGICAMAFLARRFGFLFSTLAAFVLFVVAVNVAGSAIDRLPYALRRSVTMLRFDQTSDKEAIAGSTTMREYLITEGMKEFKSRDRIFFTGRGVLQFTLGDARLNATEQEYEKWMLAVRTGRLHRTSASQLIRYGVIGTSLYYLCQLAILLYCYKASRSFARRNLPETSVATFAFALIAMHTLLGLLQDAPLTCLNAWIVALVVGLVVKQGVPAAERFALPVRNPGPGLPVPAGMPGSRA